MSAATISRVSEQARAIASRVERFVRDEVMPFERDPRCAAYGPHDALVAGA